ncbi:hypothetical protein HYH03_006580 [Edaphochlamys debaryana]|uniref:Clp R domain-containing protein n=1 Tax=Edaphochlamys debaryana TaxID=47281 RepID=A0A835Y5X3_9CHLO|nr:hypothetical protein HYH03_006580 [Edaphochlamys debaryana]|eukprot:KAG2495308.1 hypothetical protein HYH03_006580 [Edaphochlamys debaryana]
MLGGALSHDLAPSGRSAQPSTARCPERLITRVAAAEQSIDLDLDDQGVSAAVDAVIRYAINLAKASETYEVHSWMVLLGILKYESCAAAQILKKLGLEDLYGAWNEVLWALHVCDGLQPRAFCTEVKFADRAFKVITGASDFAEWHGKDKMYTEDLLMALAAGGVLEGLFPDLNLSFDRVRKVVEKHTGRTYALPDEEPSGEERGPLKSEDDVSFL